MRRAFPKQKPRKSRRYHLVDNESDTFDVVENPDWLVGAY